MPPLATSLAPVSVDDGARHPHCRHQGHRLAGPSLVAVAAGALAGHLGTLQRSGLPPSHAAVDTLVKWPLFWSSPS